MKLLISCFLLISFSCFAQDGDKRGTIKIEKTSCVKVKDNDSIYAVVDVMPEFPGGNDSLNKWMVKNVRYPKTEECFSGTIFLSFIIGVDGGVSDIEMLRGVTSAFENEAKRLIQSMPNWIPGRCNGTLVPVKINYPIKFSLR